MSIQDAINYVQQQRAAGIADDVIRVALQQSGWDAGSIQDALTGTSAGTPVPTTVSSSPRPGGLIKKVLIGFIILSIISAAASFAAMRYLSDPLSSLPFSLPNANTGNSVIGPIQPGTTRAVEFANRVIAMIERGPNGVNPKLLPIIEKAKANIKMVTETQDIDMFNEQKTTLTTTQLHDLVPYPAQPTNDTEREQLGCHISLYTLGYYKAESCTQYPELVDAYLLYNAVGVVDTAYTVNKMATISPSEAAIANSFTPGGINAFSLGAAFGVKTSAQSIIRVMAIQTGNADLVTMTGDTLLQQSDESKEAAQQRLANFNDLVFWQDANAVLDRIAATSATR